MNSHGYWNLDSGFDFRYDSRVFALALCRVPGINEVWPEEKINQMMQTDFDDCWAFNPYLFVDTGFRRTSEPLCALSVCEFLRRVPLDYRNWWSNWTRCASLSTSICRAVAVS